MGSFLPALERDMEEYAIVHWEKPRYRLMRVGVYSGSRDWGFSGTLAACIREAESVSHACTWYCRDGDLACTGCSHCDQPETWVRPADEDDSTSAAVSPGCREVESDFLVTSEGAPSNDDPVWFITLA